MLCLLCRSVIVKRSRAEIPCGDHRPVINCASSYRPKAVIASAKEGSCDQAEHPTFKDHQPQHPTPTMSGIIEAIHVYDERKLVLRSIEFAFLKLMSPKAVLFSRTSTLADRCQQAISCPSISITRPHVRASFTFRTQTHKHSSSA